MRKLKVTEMGRKSVEEFKDSNKLPLVVVLDHVRSLYNVGSVFRTSDAFLVQGICLCGITAQPPHPEIHKTALGAEDSVEWKYFQQTQDAVEWLKSMGLIVRPLHRPTMQIVSATISVGSCRPHSLQPGLSSIMPLL